MTVMNIEWKNITVSDVWIEQSASHYHGQAQALRQNAILLDFTYYVIKFALPWV